MPQIPPAYERAFQRWGYLADAEARKWGLPNGATLLAKIGYIESRFSRDLRITSSAGAQGPMQFMPATRQAYIDRYRVDPWASVDDAVHAAGLFMRDTGLEGYNPGSSTYIDEVLKAPVRLGAQTPGRRNRPKPPGEPGPSPTSSLMRFLVTAVFVVGGVALIGIGVGRAAGSSPAGAARDQTGGEA